MLVRIQEPFYCLSHSFTTWPELVSLFNTTFILNFPHSSQPYFILRKVAGLLDLGHKQRISHPGVIGNVRSENTYGGGEEF